MGPYTWLTREHPQGVRGVSERNLAQTDSGRRQENYEKTFMKNMINQINFWLVRLPNWTDKMIKEVDFPDKMIKVDWSYKLQ